MHTLTAARLALMPWQDAFGEDLARLASDERVMQYIGNGRPWSRDQSRQRASNHQRAGMNDKTTPEPLTGPT